MAKAQNDIRLSAVRGVEPGLSGRCPDCGAWNSMVETHRGATAAGATADAAADGPSAAADARSVGSARSTASPCRSSEFDRVLGGGLVPGSLVLIGGDPGIGKSTLVLQAAAALAGADGTGALRLGRGVGAADQVARRPARGATPTTLCVLSETDLDAILAAADEAASPAC